MNIKKNLTTHQIGALVTMVVIAVWGLWVSWRHITRPMGIEHMEILFLSAVLPICLILVPFYIMRVRWSYLSGTIVLLGLYVGLVKSVMDHTFFFSLSIYNLTTVTVYLASAACIYFSIRSYRERPSIGWIKSTFGIGSLLALSALAVWQVSINQMEINNYVLEQAIRGVQIRTGDIEDLEQKIEALVVEGDIPSITTAVLVNDDVVWLQGFGEQVDKGDLFDIGSITKSFVATSVLQLYDRGLIDLDDDVNIYFPFSLRHPEYPDVPISIRMLLTNRSCLSHKTEYYDTYVMGPGLRQWIVEKRGWDYRDEFEFLSYPEFVVEYLEPGGQYYQPGNWIGCQPGTDFNYSTPGFDLLGYLVELVSDQPIHEYMKENIFDPLGMTSTTATPLDNPERVVTPYERWYGVLAKTNVRLPLNQRRMVGGGGLYSTVGDLSHFLSAHMNQGEYDGYQLLEPATVKLMHSKVTSTSGDFMQVAYGYGWGFFQEEPRQMWDLTFHPRGYQGHGGRYWGYNGAMYMVDESDGAYGYILLMNHSMVEVIDHPWFFSIQFNIQDLILQEAHRLYQGLLNQ